MKDGERQGVEMNERERVDFERWAASLESESKGTQWGATLYALWELKTTIDGLIDALAQDKQQGAGKLKELISKKK